jgi:diadenosine tetraphosphate (Ap4A) HIT family hydrolase
MARLEKDQALAELAQEAELAAAFGGCVMCRLANALNAHNFVAESEHGVVVLDGFAATRGHLLVIAKNHVERAASLDWSVYADLQKLVWQANRVVEAELRPERVYVAALGASRTLPMSFPHHHVHVIPVYETGDKARPAHVFSWSSGVERYAREEAVALSAQLRGAWSQVAPLEQGHSASDTADSDLGHLALA